MIGNNGRRVVAFNQSVNRFRAARGRILRARIAALSRSLGRDVVVLDVGGRPDYWANVGFDGIGRIELLNTEAEEFDTPVPADAPPGIFARRIGDARDLSEFPDKSVDLVHSNSVIEHVGGWDDILAASREMMRVGRAGWVQTPAREFPVEPHFHLPLVHWVSPRWAARMLALSPIRAFRAGDLATRRRHVEQIHLLTRAEVERAFRGSAIHVERLVVPKSYSAWWMPGDAEG